MVVQSFVSCHFHFKLRRQAAVVIGYCATLHVLLPLVFSVEWLLLVLCAERGICSCVNAEGQWRAQLQCLVVACKQTLQKLLRYLFCLYSKSAKGFTAKCNSL